MVRTGDNIVAGLRSDVRGDQAGLMVLLKTTLLLHGEKPAWACVCVSIALLLPCQPACPPACESVACDCTLLWQLLCSHTCVSQDLLMLFCGCRSDRLRA